MPENITLLPKTTTQATGGNAWNERTIALKKGDSVAAILRELGASDEEIKAITTAFGRGKDSSPRDGYKLRVLLAPATGGKRLQPVRVIIATDTSIDAMVAWSDKGKYVAVDVRSANTVAAASDDEEDDGKGVRLYQSIYETALRNQVPRPVVDDLIRIYSYDVDFQRKVQPGRFVRDLVRRRGREQQRRQGRSAVRLAHDRRRDQEVLPLPDDRRQRRRLLRRDRQEREEVPGAQAAGGRHHAIGLRRRATIRSSAT